MPRLCEFYGIVVWMYWGDVRRHKAPHFHATYGEYAASFSIPDADLLAGALPRRQIRLVQAWAELHAEELEQAWVQAVNGETPQSIEPLR